MAKRKCVFCGGTPVTREDAVPLWLIRLLYPNGMPAGAQWLGSIDPMDGTVNEREIRPNIRKRVVNRVCSACNRGWMEADNRLIRRLVEGEALRLDEQAQGKIARWAVKTTMMVEFTDSQQQFVTPAHHHWLYEHREPPPGSCVWIARNTCEDWYLRPYIAPTLLGALWAGSDAGRKTMTQHYTCFGGLGFGSLFLLAGMTDFPQLNLHRYVRSDLTRIWPIGAECDFPCGPDLSSQDLLQLTNTAVRISYGVVDNARVDQPQRPGSDA